MKRQPEGGQVKRRIWISLLLLAVIFLIGYAFYSISFRVTDPEHVAADGKMDLKGYDFYAAQKPIFLAGEWDFYSDRLIPPEQLAGVPAPGKITVPGTFAGSGYAAFGCGTYHLTITVDERAPELLFMKIPIIQHASRIWVDGNVVSEAGTPAETAEAAEPKIAVSLAAFERKAETIDVVVWVSNYSYFKSGINNPIELGRQQLIVYANIHRWVMLALVLGGMLCIGLFHIGIYYFRSKEQINLFFGLMCVFHFTRYAFGMMEMDRFIFAHVSEVVRNMISGVSLYLIIYSLARFALCLLELRRPLFVKVLNVATGVSVLAAILMPFSAFFMDIVLLSSRLLPALVIAYLSWHIAVSVKRLKNDIRVVFVFAFALYVLFALFDLLSILVFRMPSFPAGMTLIAAQCIVLAQSYGKALTAVEETNLALEDRIAERTAELSDAYIQVAASEQYLKDMVGNISHDLKTPLTVVGLNLERLTDADKPKTEAEARRYASVAYNKTLDLQRLTRNLFEAVRMEGGKATFNPDWVKLSVLLPEVYHRYAEYVESNRVTLAVRYGEDREVLADTEKLWSVFDNTINNALRYTPEGGSISITAEPDGPEALRLSIADTGSGIPAEHLPRIFDRFYKADQSRDAKGGDSGLGLYIVKSVVEGMGAVCPSHLNRARVRSSTSGYRHGESCHHLLRSRLNGDTMRP